MKNQQRKTVSRHPGSVSLLIKNRKPDAAAEVDPLDPGDEDEDQEVAEEQQGTNPGDSRGGAGAATRGQDDE